MFRAAQGRAFLSALTIVIAVSTFGITPAQTLLSVIGHVRTSTGQPIADAAVALDGAIHAAAKTDDQGAFTLGGVRPGTYAIRISKAGFAEFVRTDVTVTQGATATVDVVLT